MLQKTFPGSVLADPVVVNLFTTDDVVSYLNEATQALQSSNLYVSPVVTDLSADQQAEIVSNIGSDSIAIVVLPPGAESEIDSIPLFLDQLAGRTDADTILVSVGGDFEAGSSTLSPGTASEIANAAEGGSLYDGLNEFVNEVQEESSAIPINDTLVGPLGSMMDFIWSLWPLYAVIFGVFAITGFFRWITRPQVVVTREAAPKALGVARMTSKDTSATPKELRTLVQQIEDAAAGIENKELRAEMRKADDHVYELFRRLRISKPDTIQQTTAKYKVRLETVLKVLNKYVDIQNNPLYFRDPNKRLSEGAKGMRDYVKGVIQNIQQIEEGTLTDFTVDSKILEATFQQADPILLERNNENGNSVQRTFDRLRRNRGGGDQRS